MSFYRFAYNAAGSALATATIPAWVPYMLARRKYRVSFLRRCGFINKQTRTRLAAQPNIWVHAVSVGEFNLAATLLDQLRPHYPHHQFVVSVTTLTGHEVAQKRLRPEDVLIFFPIEILPSMAHVVRLVGPRLAIIVETEIWPNFIYCIGSRGVPCFMANGRVSAKSFRRYHRVKPFMKDVLARIARFNMQTEHDATRVISLGAPADRVTVAGNIKFDAVKLASSCQADEALRAEIGMPVGTPVFLAAALDRTGDEDPHMLEVLARVRAEVPAAALMIVPRHPERGADIGRMVAARGYVPRRRSLREQFDSPATQVFIVDTVGELTRFYTLAKTVFVGKSLFPPGGGQNMIEPIALGLPVLYGPYTSNFRGVADTLAEHGGARIVSSIDELARATIALWNEPETARAMVAKGQAFIRAQQGATQRNVETALELLPPDGTA